MKRRSRSFLITASPTTRKCHQTRAFSGPWTTQLRINLKTTSESPLSRSSPRLWPTRTSTCQSRRKTCSKSFQVRRRQRSPLLSNAKTISGWQMQRRKRKKKRRSLRTQATWSSTSARCEAKLKPIFRALTITFLRPWLKNEMSEICQSLSVCLVNNLDLGWDRRRKTEWTSCTRRKTRKVPWARTDKSSPPQSKSEKLKLTRTTQRKSKTNRQTKPSMSSSSCLVQRTLLEASMWNSSRPMRA